MATEVIISDHAFLRWRERNTLSYNISISKLARQAYIKGITCEEAEFEPFREYLNRIISREYFMDNQFIRVYKNFVFIFANIEDGVLLLTVFEIPNKYSYVKNYAILK